MLENGRVGGDGGQGALHNGTMRHGKVGGSPMIRGTAHGERESWRVVLYACTSLTYNRGTRENEPSPRYKTQAPAHDERKTGLER